MATSHDDDGDSTDHEYADGGTLRLTDAGIEMPDMLRGYVGQFEIKTASITGQFNTTEAGLPDEEFNDTVWGTYPEGGDYNNGIESGEMVIQARGYQTKKFNIVDQRTDTAE